jgi:hypothetical protein
MHGAQVARALRRLAERVAQQGNDAVEDARRDVSMAPDGVEDFVAREHATGMLREQGEDAERLRFERHRHRIDEKPPSGQVDFNPIERNPTRCAFAFGFRQVRVPVRQPRLFFSSINALPMSLHRPKHFPSIPQRLPYGFPTASQQRPQAWRGMGADSVLAAA